MSRKKRQFSPNDQQVDRIHRVNALVKREIASLIASTLHDPQINGVTVTAVEVSRDLKSSTVYISSINCKDGSSRIENKLNSCAGFLRKQLSTRLKMRTTPSLSFKYDHSIERGIALTHLIEDLNSRHAQ